MTSPHTTIFRNPYDGLIMNQFLAILLNKHFFSTRQELMGYEAFC